MSKKPPMASDYAICFATPEGRRVLADLMTVCGVYDITTEPDATRMAMQAGARNVALHIAAKLNWKPSDFVEQARDDEDIFDRAYSFGGLDS